MRLSGIGPIDESAVGTMADVELEFEHDSDWSELGEVENGEDPDSNSEGYYGNDYPEVKELTEVKVDASVPLYHSLCFLPPTSTPPGVLKESGGCIYVGTAS